MHPAFNVLPVILLVFHLVYPLDYRFVGFADQFPVLAIFQPKRFRHQFSKKITPVQLIRKLL